MDESLENIMKLKSAVNLEYVDNLTIYPQKNESRVLVLYTGGTIGMVQVNGLWKPKEDYFMKEIRTYRDLHDDNYLKNYKSDLFVLPECNEKNRVLYLIKEYKPLVDSVNINLENWKKIAEDIQADYKNFDAFVILHGTDTLAYTASALSFMLENLGKPVIITGSQISIFGLRSDGRQNFVTALLIAGNYQIPEVCVVFNNKLMRGNRVIKYSSEKFDAFHSLQFPPLAEISITVDVNWKNVFRPSGINKFSIFTDLCTKVSLLRIHPNITLDELKACIHTGVKGVVIETYGAGNIPTFREDIINELKTAVDNGVIFVNVSQCPDSDVAAIYETGEITRKIGLVGGCNMTSVAAYMKLSYVLAKDEWDLKTKKEILRKNIRGELNQQEAPDNDLITMIGQYLSYTKPKEINDLKMWLEPFLLSRVISTRDLEQIKLLHQSNCNLSATNIDGRTPLHFACAEGYTEIVKYLVECGANVHAKDRFNRTPLIEAIHNNHFDIMTILLKTGAHLTTRKRDLGTSLCHLASKGSLNELKMYMLAGADLDTPDYSGRTALYMACLNNHIDVITFLLANNCDPRKEDKIGLNPMQIANKLNLNIDFGNKI